MKNIYLFAGSLIIAAASSAAAQNPVITHMYTADPSARVFNDTLYLYPSHDRDDARWWDMVDYHVFSTTDLVNFTDHGQTLHIDEITWAGKYAWAPDAIMRNGKYYLSYSGDGRILYAWSDEIFGPYEFKGEILGRVNSGTNHHSIVEYKGQWYLFYHTSDLALQHIPEESEEREYVQWRRSVAVDKLFYNDDGTIQKVNPTQK
jgi:hypothetical protein